MKDAIGKIRQFMATPLGIVILFVLIFYVMTFSIYWFYSPGPEERRQAEADKNDTAVVENAPAQSSSQSINN